MPKEEEKKSAEEREKDGSKPISRRVFLKDSGLLAAAPTLGSLATSAPAATPTAAAGPAATSRLAGKSAAAVALEFTVNGGGYRFNLEAAKNL